jgi:hypothetical protein
MTHDLDKLMREARAAERLAKSSRNDVARAQSFVIDFMTGVLVEDDGWGDAIDQNCNSVNRFGGNVIELRSRR